MATIPGKPLTVRFKGAGTADTQVKLGDRDLAPHLRSLDIHIRAGELPEVILRPQVPEAALVIDDGIVTLAPDVEYALRQLGWLGPEDLMELRARCSELMEEAARDRRHAASLEKELATVREQVREQIDHEGEQGVEGSDTLLIT